MHLHFEILSPELTLDTSWASDICVILSNGGLACGCSNEKAIFRDLTCSIAGLFRTSYMFVSSTSF